MVSECLLSRTIFTSFCRKYHPEIVHCCNDCSITHRSTVSRRQSVAPAIACTLRAHSSPWTAGYPCSPLLPGDLVPPGIVDASRACPSAHLSAHALSPPPPWRLSDACRPPGGLAPLKCLQAVTRAQSVRRRGLLMVTYYGRDGRRQLVTGLNPQDTWPAACIQGNIAQIGLNSAYRFCRFSPGWLPAANRFWYSWWQLWTRQMLALNTAKCSRWADGSTRHLKGFKDAGSPSIFGPRCRSGRHCQR